MKLIFLGTGSIPTIHRNSQGILIESESESLLVDCGEGIQRQLLKSKVNYSKISSILITHEHMDHIDGLTGVLALLLYNDKDKIINIFAPANALEIIKMKINSCIPNLEESRINFLEVKDKDCFKLNVFKIQVFKTYHTSDSTGYTISNKNKKIAVMGDLKENFDLIKDQIINVDIAVIDAVHIKIEEAAKLAKDANVKRLFLLPISNHMEVASVEKIAKKIFANTIIPNDFDEVNI